MKNYIPKSKGDDEAVERLKSLSFESIRADVPELLEWLQDMNWPVGRGIAEYLTPHVNEMKNELLHIFNTNDEVWKYWIIRSLIAWFPNKLDEELLVVIRRIAEHPTKSEKIDEVDESAKEFLLDYDKM